MASGQLVFSNMEVLRGHDGGSVPGALGHHDLLVSNKDMLLLLRTHGHTCT
jgi:hypothetical protein